MNEAPEGDHLCHNAMCVESMQIDAEARVTEAETNRESAVTVELISAAAHIILADAERPQSVQCIDEAAAFLKKLWHAQGECYEAPVAQRLPDMDKFKL